MAFNNVSKYRLPLLDIYFFKRILPVNNPAGFDWIKPPAFENMQPLSEHIRGYGCQK
jgi:hypothetical protein